MRPAGSKWSLRLDSHQHLTAYETAALLFCATERKWIRQPDLHQSRVVTNDVRRSLRFGGIEWTRTPDSHRVSRFCRPMARRLCPAAAGCANKMGRPTGCAPAQRLSRSRMLLLHHSLHRILKLDPPAGAAPAWSALRVRCIADLCHGGMESGAPARICTSSFRFRKAACRIYYTSGAKKSAPCRCCPGTRGLEDRRARCYTNDAKKKVVAAAGIAPASPRLQRGANLSQLNSLWSLYEVTLPGLSVIGRLLCF